MKTLPKIVQIKPLIKLIFIGSATIFISNCGNLSQTSADAAKNQAAQKDSNNKVWVRYIVTDIDKTAEFYKNLLGFEVVQSTPGFAQLSLGNLNLLVNKPGAGGAGQNAPDGQTPAPGGWNRIQIRVTDLEAAVETLKSKEAVFKTELIAGNGGKQILLADPSGNLIELFEAYGQK